MASKRKTYRGIGPQHRKSAVAALSAMRASQREFNRQLKKGNCKMALYALTDARYKHGEYRSEILWAAARGARGSGHAVAGMEQRFYKACVK